jgi:predicted transport protein
MRHQDNIFKNIANNLIMSSHEKHRARQSGISLYDNFFTLVFNAYKDLSVVSKKRVTSFCKENREIFSIEIQTSAIKITLNLKFGALKDTENLFRDVSKIGHWGNGDYQAKFENDEHFVYVVKLIKQIY